MYARRDVRLEMLMIMPIRPFILRRQKSDKGADGKSIVDLPPKTSRVVYVQFTKQHAKAHVALWNFSKDKIQQYFGVCEEEFARITINHLIAIGRLRQLC